MRTGIRARFVVGHDGRDHVVYERGELVYENDRVLFVGHGYPEPVDRAVEYGDAVVSPGFVDLDALADIDRGAEPPSKLLVGAIDNHVHAGPVKKASPS